MLQQLKKSQQTNDAEYLASKNNINGWIIEFWIGESSILKSEFFTSTLILRILSFLGREAHKNTVNTFVNIPDQTFRRRISWVDTKGKYSRSWKKIKSRIKIVLHFTVYLHIIFSHRKIFCHHHKYIHQHECYSNWNDKSSHFPRDSQLRALKFWKLHVQS